MAFEYEIREKNASLSEIILYGDKALASQLLDLLEKISKDLTCSVTQFAKHLSIDNLSNQSTDNDQFTVS